MEQDRLKHIRGRSYTPDFWEKERVRKIIAETRQKLKPKPLDLHQAEKISLLLEQATEINSAFTTIITDYRDGVQGFSDDDMDNAINVAKEAAKNLWEASA